MGSLPTCHMFIQRLDYGDVDEDAQVLLAIGGELK